MGPIIYATFFTSADYSTRNLVLLDTVAAYGFCVQKVKVSRIRIRVRIRQSAPICIVHKK